MKNYAKTGGKNGKPAYRTAATFRYRQYVKVSKIKTRGTEFEKTVK